MGKPVGWRMREFDVNDLLLDEINLMKYINQNVMIKFLPKNIQRAVQLLIDKGEYTLDGVILKRCKPMADLGDPEVTVIGTAMKDGPKDMPKKEAEQLTAKIEQESSEQEQSEQEEVFDNF